MPLHLVIRLLVYFILANQQRVQGQFEPPPSNASYLRLPAIQQLPSKNQFIERVGPKRGSIGTEDFPVVLPPLKPREHMARHPLYERLEKYELMCNATIDGIGEHEFVRYMFHYHAQVTTLNVNYTNISDPEYNLMVRPFIMSIPDVRTTLITFFCLRRRYFDSLRDYNRMAATIYPDYYQHCPRACAPRTGPGLDPTMKDIVAVEHDWRVCQRPKEHSPYTSRACAHKLRVYYTHRDDYACECQNGHGYFEDWRGCYPLMSSLAQECDWRGAYRRTFFEGDLRRNVMPFRCDCRPTYHGNDCGKLKDPCTMSIGNVIPGNLACAVKQGNKCIPIAEYGRYTCECAPGFDRIPDDAFPKGRVYDNCLREIDPCSLKGCVQGVCVLSDLGTALELKGRKTEEPFIWAGGETHLVARCVCKPGWTGDKCEHPLVGNSWTGWSAWSPCEPLCQKSVVENPPHGIREMVPPGQSTPRWGMRLSTRFRDCIGQSADCRQHVAELGAEINEEGGRLRQWERRGCRPRPCDRLLYLTMGKRAVRRSRMQKQVRETLEQAQTVHLWIVFALTFIFTIFGFFAAFATKVYSEKAFEQFRVPRKK